MLVLDADRADQARRRRVTTLVNMSREVGRPDDEVDYDVRDEAVDADYDVERCGTIPCLWLVIPVLRHCAPSSLTVLPLLLQGPARRRTPPTVRSRVLVPAGAMGTTRGQEPAARGASAGAEPEPRGVASSVGPWCC